MKQKINAFKIIEKLLSLFPILHLFLIALSLLNFLHSLNLKWGFLLLFFIYLFPVLIWRSLFINIKEGKHLLGKKSANGSSWLISHYLQYVFICIPLFERLLIIIPGAYSVWLRLWGSSIGKGVIWAPVMALHDRSLVDIGNYVIIGGHVHIASHFLIRKKGLLSSYIKKVTIGDRSIIGAETSIGPGTKLIDNTFLPAQSRSLCGRIERGQFGKTTRT